MEMVYHYLYHKMKSYPFHVFLMYLRANEGDVVVHEWLSQSQVSPRLFGGKKFIRGDNSVSLKEDLLYELGDVLWYLSNLAFECGYTLQEVAEVNLNKLGARMLSDTIKGDDDRR